MSRGVTATATAARLEATSSAFALDAAAVAVLRGRGRTKQSHGRKYRIRETVVGRPGGAGRDGICCQEKTNYELERGGTMPCLRKKGLTPKMTDFRRSSSARGSSSLTLRAAPPPQKKRSTSLHLQLQTHAHLFDEPPQAGAHALFRVRPVQVHRHRREGGGSKHLCTCVTQSFTAKKSMRKIEAGG